MQLLFFKLQAFLHSENTRVLAPLLTYRICRLMHIVVFLIFEMVANLQYIGLSHKPMITEST